MDKQPKYGFRKSKKGLVSGIIAASIFGVSLGGIVHSANSYIESTKEAPSHNYDIANWKANTVDEIKDEIEHQLNEKQMPEGMSEEEFAAHDWYEIRWGDTVWGITTAQGLDLEAFARANGIENPELIYAGDWVMLDITGTVNVNDYEDAGQSYQYAQREPQLTIEPIDTQPQLKTETVKVEKPVKKEPVVEKPVVEQPKVEEPVVEEPVVEEPVEEEPVEEDPVEEDPVEEEPVDEAPVEEEPEGEEPVEEDSDDEVPSIIKTEVKTSPISFEVEYVLDKNLAPGEEEIRTEGVDGQLTETFEYTYVNDELVSAELVHSETIPAVNQVVAVGGDQETDPLVYTGHALGEDGNPLVNESLNVYDKDILVDTTETDDIGYFITHLLPDIMYDIQGEGYHSQVTGTDKDQFIVEDIDGETEIGRTLKTPQTHMKFRPSVKAFDLESTEYTVAQDDSWIIIDQVLELNIGETIYLTPNEDYITGKVFNVASYETNGFETLIYTALTEWDDLIEYLKVDTGQDSITVGEMEIHEQPWITIETREVENEPMTANLFSLIPNLDTNVDLRLIFNVDFAKLFEGKVWETLTVEDYGFRMDEFELTKDPIVIPVGDSEFIIYGQHVELIYGELKAGLDSNMNFDLSANDKFVKRKDNMYQAKYEDRQVTYVRDQSIEFVDGDYEVFFDKDFNFNLQGKNNFITRHGSTLQLKYEPLELNIHKNEISKLLFKGQEVIFDTEGKYSYSREGIELTINKQNIDIMLRMGENYIQFNPSTLEFSDGNFIFKLNADQSMDLKSGASSIRMNQDGTADLILDMGEDRLQVNRSAFQYTHGDVQFIVDNDLAIKVVRESNSLKLNSNNFVEIDLYGKQFHVNIDHLKNLNFTEGFKNFSLSDFDISNKTNEAMEYLQSEVNKKQKTEFDFNQLANSMKDRFKGSVNTRVILDGGVNIKADINRFKAPEFLAKSNLNARFETKMTLVFEEQEDLYRIPLAVLTVPYVPVATISIDLVFDVYGNMEVITSMGLTANSWVELKGRKTDSDQSLDFDTPYASVEGEANGVLGLEIIPMIGIDYLGINMPLGGYLLPSISFQGEVSLDDTVEASGVVEGKIDGNVRASVGFNVGLNPETTSFEDAFYDETFLLGEEERTFFNNASISVSWSGVNGELEIVNKTFPIWSYTSGQDGGNYFIKLANGELRIENFEIEGDTFESNFFGDSLLINFIQRRDDLFEQVNSRGTYLIVDLDKVISKAGSNYQKIVRSGWTIPGNRRDVNIHAVHVNSPDVLNDVTVYFDDLLVLEDLYHIDEIKGLPDGLTYKYDKKSGEVTIDNIGLGMAGEHVVYVISYELITGDETGIGDYVYYNDEDRYYEIRNKNLHNYYIDSFKLTILDPNQVDPNQL